MTTGEQLDLNSTVSNTTALDHLRHPKQGGSGDCNMIPYDDIIFELGPHEVSLALDSTVFEVDRTDVEKSISISREFEVNLHNTNKEYHHGCQ